MPEKENFIIPRIPLDKPGLCAHALIVSGAQAFEVIHTCQKDMHVHVKDPKWGTEPIEITKMARTILPDSHICVKEGWNFDELTKLFDEGRIVAVLDVTDMLSRYDKVLKSEVGKDEVDGHYVTLAGIHDGMAVIVDPSADEIVHEGKNNDDNFGVRLTDCENIYLLPLSSLDEMWHDTKKDGTLNDHWALVMLHPDDDASVLEKYKNQGKI
jgi:hypothetical protein